VLNRDIHESHAGYIHFINALALKLFGYDAVSPRYPAAFVTWILSALVFVSFVRSGPPGMSRVRSNTQAFLASLIPSCLGFVQISSPSVHVYAFFLTYVVVCSLLWFRRESPVRAPLAGFLCATLFLVRQLTGAFVGAAVLAFLFLERREGGASSRLAKGYFTFVCLGLSIYLATGTNELGFLLFGVWPSLILLAYWFQLSITDRTAWAIALRFAAGIALGFVPILGYHLGNGSLAAWFDDSFVQVFRFTQLRHTKLMSYAFYYFELGRHIDGLTIGTALNIAYWTVLLLATLFGNILLFFPLLWNAWRRIAGNTAAAEKELVQPLPVIASFYGLVPLFNQIPFYLYAAAPFALLSILWQLRDRRRSVPAVILGMSLFVCVIGAAVHAGQPYTRPVDEVLAAKNIPLQRSAGLERLSLLLDPAELAVYARLVEYIQRNSTPSQPIFVFPNNSELYFLSRRKNPFPIWNTTLSIVSDEEQSRFLRELGAESPVLVVHHKNYFYNNAVSERILSFVREGYASGFEDGDFEIFVKRAQ
jgi:hypothetical protein